ncbi:MAG: hypothetical protein QXI19_09255, partial [Candidatus Caldarchaeum sp.]
GNDHIKMATSVIDYIFRELAVTYLARQDFMQVSAEDLRSDSIGRPKEEAPEFLEEEVVNDHHTEPTVPGQSVEDHESAGFRLPPLREKPLEQKVPSVLGSLANEQIRKARLQGYEGDPCPECGQFTMVRNGTCLKCVSCGATSGCS